jgi:hypothetical protein
MNKLDHLIGATGLALFIFALVLTGCEPKPQGPPLLTECKFETPLNVNIIVLDDKAMREKWEYYNRTKLPEGAEVKGFAIHNKATGLHTLFVLEIRGQADHDRIETIGHELMHSFCGDWHPRNYG